MLKNTVLGWHIYKIYKHFSIQMGKWLLNTNISMFICIFYERNPAWRSNNHRAILLKGAISTCLYEEEKAAMLRAEEWIAVLQGERSKWRQERTSKEKLAELRSARHKAFQEYIHTKLDRRVNPLCPSAIWRTIISHTRWNAGGRQRQGRYCSVASMLNGHSIWNFMFSNILIFYIYLSP